MLGLAPLTNGGLCLAIGFFLTPAEYESMLIIEDGQTSGGVANANSLITYSEVSAYATLVGNTAWAAATELAQEQAIYRVMRWFRSKERSMKGRRTWTTQALAYPRQGVWAYGREIDYNEIPLELKQALMEGALLEQATQNILQPSRETNIKRIRKKLDGMEKEIEYDGPGEVGAISLPTVNQLMSDFLESNSSWQAW